MAVNGIFMWTVIVLLILKLIVSLSPKAVERRMSGKG